MSFEFFLFEVCPPFLLVTGIITNILIILIYTRPRFSKLPTRRLWISLAIVEIICIIQITKHFIPYVKNLSDTTRFFCKLLHFTSHFGSINAWILVFVSVDRFLAIVYPRLYRLSYKYQMLTLMILVFTNLTFYSQKFVYTDTFYLNNTNSTICNLVPHHKTAWIIFNWMDLFNSTLIPFLFMLVSSLYLSHVIFISRRKLLTKGSSKVNRRLKKDIRFSITLISLNVIFVVLNLPIIIYLIILMTGNFDPIIFSIVDNLYYLSYCLNFFIYIIVNSNFRKEFFRIIIRNRKLSKRLQTSGLASQPS